jgi:hypothetical protein
MLAAALRSLLSEHPVTLRSELDEQGLQVAALRRTTRPFVISTSELTICSPFSPHQPYLGRCGAHFVGLNARRLSFDVDGAPAIRFVREHWMRHRAAIAERIAR